MQSTRLLYITLEIVVSTIFVFTLTISDLKAQRLKDISISVGMDHFSSSEKIGGENIYPKYGNHFTGEYNFALTKGFLSSIGLGFSTSAIGGAVGIIDVNEEKHVFKSSRIVSKYIQLPFSIKYKGKLFHFKTLMESKIIYAYKIDFSEGTVKIENRSYTTKLNQLYNKNLLLANFGVGVFIRVSKGVYILPKIGYTFDISPSITDTQSSSSERNHIYFKSLNLSLDIKFN